MQCCPAKQVLTAWVTKDNQLQSILQNSLWWWRSLRTGRKGHKCFAPELQVLDFFTWFSVMSMVSVVVDIHMPCFCLPFWTTQQMILSEQLCSTLGCVCLRYSQRLQAGSMQEEAIFHQCSFCALKAVKYLKYDKELW